MSMRNIDDLLTAVREEGLTGWLFLGFKHRDALADRILGLSTHTINSRPWIYAVGASGSPIKIVHAIEASMLDSLPGQTIVYSSREKYIAAIDTLQKGVWAAQVSDLLPVISYLDAGSVDLLRSQGLKIVSSAALVQRAIGLLDATAIASHQRAAQGLYSIVEDTWSFLKQAREAGKAIYEGDVRAFMLEGMRERGLETDNPPVVGAGGHSGDPHYDFQGQGGLIAEGDVIQLDLWAKESGPDAIFADISWVCVYSDEVPHPVAEAWKDLRAARDEAVRFIRSELAAGRRPSGASVDERVRRVLIDAGRASAIRHRTGHGIDTACHGSGVNIDSIEFPDERILLDGACFSIEPGLYYEDFGLRTEIDGYLESGELIISGKTPQIDILHCGVVEA